MADYKIKLGVELDTSDISDKIKDAIKDVKPIKINIDTDYTKSQVNIIKSQIESLNDIKIGGLTFSNNIVKSVDSIGKNIANNINASIQKGLNIDSVVANEVKGVSKTLEIVGKQSGQNLGGALESGFKKSFDLDKFVSDETNRIMSKFGLSGEEAFKGISSSMKNCFTHMDKVESALKGITNEFDKLNKTEMFEGSLHDESYYKSKIRDNILTDSSYISHVDQVSKDVYDFVRNYNSKGYKVQVPESIRQREEYNNIRKRLGAAFTSSSGTDLETFILELNREKGEVIDLSKGIDAAFDQLYDSIQRGKALVNGGKNSTDITGSLAKSNIDNVDDEVARSINNIKEAQLRAISPAYDDVSNKIDIVNRKIKSSEQELKNLGNQMNQIDDFAKVNNLSDDDAESRKSAIADAYQSESVVYNNLMQQRAQLESELSKIKQGLQDVSHASNQTENALDGTFDGAVKDAQELTGAVEKTSDVINQMDGAIKSIGSGSGLDEIADKLKKISNINIDFKDGVGIDSLKKELSNLGFDNIGIDKVTKDLEEMGISIRKVASSFNKEKGVVDLSIAGVDNVGKAVTAISQIGVAAENAGYEVKDMSLKTSQSMASIVSDVEKIKKKLKFNDSGISGFDLEIQKIEKSYKDLSNRSVELEQNIQSLKNALKEIVSANAVNDIDALRNANEKYKDTLEKVENQIKANKTAEEQAYKSNIFTENKNRAVSRLKNIFSDNSEAARQFGSELKRLEQALESCGDEKGLKLIEKQIGNLEQRVRQANVQTQTFGERLKAQFSKYSAYFGIAEMFMYVEQGLRDMFEQVKLIDSAMTELRKVTDETDVIYNKFLSNAAERAKAIGTTIDGLVSSTAEFAKIGYSFEDSQGLAEVANVYKLVGDNIESAEDATQSLISTMAAFKGEMNGMSNTDFAMSIVDKFNEVSNKYSIGSGGLGEALTRSASSMAAANNTLDETIALITAANEVVNLCHAT